MVKVILIFLMPMVVLAQRNIEDLSSAYCVYSASENQQEWEYESITVFLSAIGFHYHSKRVGPILFAAMEDPRSEEIEMTLFEEIDDVLVKVGDSKIVDLKKISPSGDIFDRPNEATLYSKDHGRFACSLK